MLNMKTLKGLYSDDTSYSVGDVVIEGGNVYHLQKPCASGTKPADNRYWGQLNQVAAEIVLLFTDLWNDVADLQTAVANAQEKETAISALIAPEYTKTTFAKGALVTHDGKLYKAKNAIGTAEDWTVSHWDQTTVFAELSAILTSIGTLNTSVAALQGVVFDEKTLVLESSTESSTKKWAVTVDDSDGLQVEEIVEEGGDT